MPEAKVQLSDAEISLFADPAVILTKNRILEATRLLLDGLLAQMQETAAGHWPGGALFTIPPKVSRGEQYLGFPWLVLDYPRRFGSPDLFAIRSFFWWGHFFSSTLHIDGHYLHQYRAPLSAAYPLLAQGNYYVHTGSNPWAHHFEPDNYTPVSSLTQPSFAALLHRQAPIKIAAKWPLQEWPFAANKLLASWETLLRICLD